MRKRNTTKRYPFIAWLAATFIIFIAIVNTAPGIVPSMTNIPIVGKFIKVLDFTNESGLKNTVDPEAIVSAQNKNLFIAGNPVSKLSFENGKASGGTITDNVNVKSITVTDDGEAERIIINFTNRGEEQPLLVAPYFEVVHDENPSMITVSINGARAFDANDFIDLKKSDYAEDAYLLVTHDDSLIRFVVVFKTPVFIEGTEYADPAQLEISLSKDERQKMSKLYSVRTAPLLFGGEIANLEEYLHEETGIRILRESGILFTSWESEFYLEIGLFDNKELAEQKVSEIIAKYGPELDVYIEEIPN